MKRILLIVFLATGSHSAAHGQGMLPPQPTPAGAPSETTGYIQIGQPIPETLSLVNLTNESRSILSYKAVGDLLVLVFTSPRCAEDSKGWVSLKRLIELRSGWHVVFVAVSVQAGETLPELAQALQKAGISIPVARDVDHRLAHALHATATPEVMIIDEWGTLRYRGGLESVTQAASKWVHTTDLARALDALVGHIDPVPEPEPAGFSGCSIP